MHFSRSKLKVRVEGSPAVAIETELHVVHVFLYNHYINFRVSIQGMHAQPRLLGAPVCWIGTCFLYFLGGRLIPSFFPHQCKARRCWIRAVPTPSASAAVTAQDRRIRWPSSFWKEQCVLKVTQCTLTPRQQVWWQEVILIRYSSSSLTGLHFIFAADLMRISV